MLDSKFDMPRISRFVLGRYWTTASDQDKQNFQKLFEDYVVRAYAARFSQYSGEQVKVIGARPESETVTLVTSQILRENGAPPAKIDRKSTRLNSSHANISYAVFCLKKKKKSCGLRRYRRGKRIKRARGP